MAGGAVGLAGEGAQAGLGQRLGGFVLQLLRHRAVQLGGQLRRVVEVLRADLEQLVAGALLQPLGEGRVVLCARGL